MADRQDQKKPSVVARFLTANDSFLAEALQNEENRKNDPKAVGQAPVQTEIEQMIINWNLGLNTLFDDTQLPNEIKAQILKPLLLGPDERAMTLTAENIVDVVKTPGRMRNELLTARTSCGDVARYCFWRENIVSLRPNANKRFGLTSEHGGGTTSHKAIVLCLPPLQHRQHIWRLQLHPCTSPHDPQRANEDLTIRARLGWAQQSSLDTWAHLRDITNGAYQFRNLQKIEVYFEGIESRMRFYGWTISIHVGGTRMEIDGDTSQLPAQTQLHHALQTRHGAVIDTTLPGFVLEKKAPAITCRAAESSENDDDVEEWVNDDDLSTFFGLESDEEHTSVLCDDGVDEAELSGEDD